MSRSSSSSSRGGYDKLKYQTIYPQNIDANLTPSEGRKITQCQSVVCPTLEEMLIAARNLGFADSFVDPTKSLPCSQSQLRQVPAPRGCLRVAVKAPASAHYVKKSDFDTQTRGLINEDIPNKYVVMRKISEMIKAKGGVRPTPINMKPQHQQKEANVAPAKAASSGKRR